MTPALWAVLVPAIASLLAAAAAWLRADLAHRTASAAKSAVERYEANGHGAASTPPPSSP